MSGIWPQLWSMDEGSRVFEAVADFNRAANRPARQVSTSRYGSLSGQERINRNAKNKAARKARRQTRSKR